GDEERRLRRASGRWLDAAQAHAEEPGLNPPVRGAVLFPQAQGTPIPLVPAPARPPAPQGPQVPQGAPGGGLAGRAGGLPGAPAAEGPVRADAVVVAAGPWSPALASPLGVALQVRPNRGQLVMLRPRAVALRHVLTWRGSYLVPKPDGTVV